MVSKKHPKITGYEIGTALIDGLTKNGIQVKKAAYAGSSMSNDFKLTIEFGDNSSYTITIKQDVLAHDS